MPPRAIRILSLTLLGAVLSCQSPDISAELDEYTDLLNIVNGLACECPQDLGYASLAECNDAFPTVNAMDRQCLANALDGSEEAGKDYLDCANAALRAYEQCLELNPGCEEGWYSNCNDNFGGAVATCAPLPADVQPAFAACTL